MQTEQQITMNALLNESSKVWLAYLHRVGQDEVDSGLSMQSIFHFAAPRAKDHLDLDWAEVAIRAAEIEARRRDGVERENALRWSMNLRSWFISKMGSRPFNMVLDKEIIMTWIMDGLKMPLPAVKKKTESFWENMVSAKNSSNPDDLHRATNDLLELRNLKHRLNVAQVLAESGELVAGSVLYDWLEIREQLP